MSEVYSNLSVGVGLAHRPGRNTINRDISRWFQRLFLYILHLRCIPFKYREHMLIASFKISKYIDKSVKAIFWGASKSNAFENALLLMIFNATAIANLCDNAASSPLTNLYVGLHTADPGEAGDQTSSEVAYGSYARVPVLRSGSGWTVVGNAVTPVAAITFPTGTSGTDTPATHFHVGKSVSGAGFIYYSGTITPNPHTGNTFTPQLANTTQITEE